MVKASPDQKELPLTFEPLQPVSAPINRDKLIRLLNELAVGNAAKNVKEKELAWNVYGRVTREMDAHQIMTMINESGLTHLVVSETGEFDSGRFSKGATIALLQMNKENREAYQAALRAEPTHISRAIDQLAPQINIRVLVNGTEEAQQGARRDLQKILTKEQIIEQLEKLRGRDFPPHKVAKAIEALQEETRKKRRKIPR